MGEILFTNYDGRGVCSNKFKFGPLLNELFDFSEETVRNGMGEVYPCSIKYII